MPDDDWLEKINPVLKLWMYESWCQDQEDKNNFVKNYVILNGSFSNAEMARRMVKMDNPDYESSDEDYEKVSQEIVNDSKQEIRKNKPRRKIVNG